jgi:DNA-binding response OmpR family regulator
MTRRGKAWQRLAPKMERLPAMKREQAQATLLFGIKALIVEDEQLLALEVENLLRDHGAAQVWSTGALSGARRILSANTDIAIVLLDLKLQDGSGEELLAELAGNNIPVIITTGYTSYACGQAQVIHKPYPSASLLEKIQAALRIAKT